MIRTNRWAWSGPAVAALLLVSGCGGKAETENEGGSGGSNTGGSGGSGGTVDTGGTGGTIDTGGTGGTGGTNNTGGTGGDPGPVVHAKKVDLLFMIDNSASMADKQNVLAASVPRLISRLTSPHCIDPSGAFVAAVGATEPCPAGSTREFPPVRDMHIGVISSSLGGHGADSCSNVATQNWNPRQDEMSHLVTRGPAGTMVDTYEGKGFLNWDPGGQDSPPGESDPATLSSRFSHLANGVGQDGCGFESSLEAWYRFLVDPTPYQKMVPVPCNASDSHNSCRGPQGVDQVVLQQRADFLRQDSVVAVVMLTDENDCSVIDEGQSYLALQALDGTGAFRLARGTEACKTDPYGPNCKSCWEVSANEYPECAAGWPNPSLDDTLGLRCYRQKERFGIDFLQPVERYVTALTSTHLEDGTVSPLFCSTPTSDGQGCTTAMRSPTQVVLAGIVGVPWQDIAKDSGNLGAGFQDAAQIDWDLILGDPMKNIEPKDPLMVESIDPRSGTHPVTGQPLAPPGSGVQHAVNGSEVLIPSRNDLQYTCIFKLPTPMDCSLPENAFGCDCYQGSESPLCWNGSSYGTMQHYAKAYPGKRHLSVLKGIGSQAVVSSICAPNLTDQQAADYGYGPALDALTRRLAENLR